MDNKTSNSHADSSSSANPDFLHHLNKLSHKISKPTKTPPLNLRPPPAPPLHHQPPVYNISKRDFRDAVQKLTGSSSHAPPQIHAPKSTRLQRIRPPPLKCAAPPVSVGGGLSPLPPLPTCHAASESPISAYMRFLRTASVDSDPRLTSRTVTMNPALANVELYPFPSSSPRSPCQPLSPNLLMSPTGGGSLGLPTVSGVPSPKWRDC